MKSIAAIAITLVYLVSFVTAHHQPTTMMTSDSDDHTMTMTSGLRGHHAVGVLTNTINAKNNNVLVMKSNVLLSTSDRVQLAKTIKEMMANSPEADMSTEQIFGVLGRVATTPGVLTSAAGVISAARSGNTAAMAGHAVNLLGAVLPVVLPPTTPAPVLPPVIAPISAPMIPTTPISAPAAPSAGLPFTSA